MIWTFKIELLFGMNAEEACVRIIEIDSSSTLEALHYAIQDAVAFDDDHLYEFYLSRTERSGGRTSFNDENETIYDLTLEDVFPLEKGKKLYYLFDYGDEWLFKITKSGKKPHNPEKGVKYPAVIEKLGENPEQYPMWEDE